MSKWALLVRQDFFVLPRRRFLPTYGGAQEQSESSMRFSAIIRRMFRMA